MKLRRWLHDLPGVIVRDLGRYHRALACSGPGHQSDPRGWISICNRIETLTREEDETGVRCNWTWGSGLHAPRVLSRLGARLMQAALAEWPIKFARQPAVIAERPKLSFIFAHSGAERLPQLRQTIRSVFAQQDVPCEVVVVDQSEQPQLAMLPAPVIYRHLSKEGVAPGWYKSWAYNVGARLATGSILVFQDGDVCAPAGYARELVSAIEGRGHGAASVQRLLFYLSQSDSQSVQKSDTFAPGIRPTLAFQNWKGGTIAIRKDAFTSIGGFDEGFVDWGGEDDEFYDRCAAVGHCRSGYLPFVHLWHPPQPDRKQSSNPNIADVMPWRLSLSHETRIAELSQRHFGNPVRPDPVLSYKAQRQS